MCFLNLTTKIIAREYGIEELITSDCYGMPCVALKETGEHLHNDTANSFIQRVEMDMLDHDTLLKLQGKSN